MHALVCRTAVRTRTLTRLLASAAPSTSYETVLTETRGGVGLITLNRPKALNALSDALMRDLIAAAVAFDKDDSIGGTD